MAKQDEPKRTLQNMHDEPWERRVRLQKVEPIESEEDKKRRRFNEQILAMGGPDKPAQASAVERAKAAHGKKLPKQASIPAPVGASLKKSRKSN